MTAIPSNLFVAFVEQGITKGFINDITKTLDGEFYLHNQYIQNSIIKSVESNGRGTVEKLAEELCVEQSQVEKALHNIAQDNQWSVIDDLILTQKSVDAIAEEFETEVKSTGHVSIIAQTQQKKLPYSLLNSIAKKLDNDEYIRYSQIPDFIATKSYIDECKSNITSSLANLEEPYPTFKLQKSQNIQEELFYLLLERIIKDDTSLGFLRGKRSRATFEPKNYKNRQLVLIKSIFDSNDYISFNTIENLYTFSPPSDLIADNYDKDQYICLNSCFIKCSVKDSAKATVESINEYCDVNEVLPSGLLFEDVNKVVDIIMSDLANNSKKYIVLDGGYIAKADYIQKLVADSNNYLRNLSRSVKQKQNKNHTVNVSLSESDIIKAFESVGCPHNIAEKVVPFTRNLMCTQFAELLQTPYVETDFIVSGDQWIMENKSRELRKLLNLRQSIYFNFQAAKVFTDSASRKSLEKYILKNQCTEYLFHLVVYSVLDQSYNKAEVGQSSSLCITLEDIEEQKITDAKQQKYVISYFIRENDHKYDNTSIIEIEALMKKKDLEQFVTKFLVQDKQRLFEDNILDSKETRDKINSVVYNQLHSQLESLPVSKKTAPQLLHLVSLIVFQKTHQIPLYVSGKFVPAILADLKPSLPEADQHLLHTVHMSVMGNGSDEDLSLFTKLKQLGMKQ